MGLAPVIVQEVFRTIRRLEGEGMTVLLVEQFARAALEVADYAYVMERGREGGLWWARLLGRSPLLGVRQFVAATILAGTVSMAVSCPSSILSMRACSRSC